VTDQYNITNVCRLGCCHVGLQLPFCQRVIVIRFPPPLGRLVLAIG
jgi:hypothetical protein